MSDRLVVVGGDAAGMSAAMQVRRRQPEREIVVLERGRWTSYSACGIPYLVGGSVGDIDDLVARSPETFRDRHGIDVRLGHEVRAVDLDARRVEAWDDEAGRVVQLGFDTLHIATGARPLRPDLPGIDHPMVHGVQTLDDAATLQARVDGEPAEGGSGGAGGGQVRRVAVVGGGYIGLEMAEAFVQRGREVTLVEAAEQLMPTLDADVAAPLVGALGGMGVEVRLGTPLEAIDDGGIVAGGEHIDVDLVVLGLGTRPNGELAAGAGIEVGAKGAVRVDRRQRTSADGVWAAGDCCESYHLVARAPVHIALGTVANKQGRVAGINMGGGYASFPGVLGTAVTKVCNVEIGRTGLSRAEAERYGFATVEASIEGESRAGYLPERKRITVKAIAEVGTGRLIGAQIVGEEGTAKRIDVLATAIQAGLTAAQVVDLDLGYAPPFGPVWDPVHVVARELVRGLDRART
ncbi:MAG TPA: FAD-dependent oxidoreductase [Acidimicrobiales bacterium]|nr:FAD-dependent oxidoreductase [Acidimicrobiales bacterium]